MLCHGSTVIYVARREDPMRETSPAEIRRKSTRACRPGPAIFRLPLLRRLISASCRVAAPASAALFRGVARRADSSANFRESRATSAARVSRFRFHGDAAVVSAASQCERRASASGLSLLTSLLSQPRLPLPMFIAALSRNPFCRGVAPFSERRIKGRWKIERRG